MLFDAVEMVAVALCCVIASVHCVHAFQKERYRLPAYRQWLRRTQDRYLKENVATGFAASLLSWYLPMLLSLFISVESTRTAVANWVTLAGFAVVAIAFALIHQAEPAKKPLVLTMRARRLFVVLTVLYAGAVLLLNLLSIPPYIAYAGVPFIVLLGGRIMDPVEGRINAGFYEEARRKLAARGDLIKIGITGSYGKTQTKFILREILSRKYEVLATPASFNTAMGLSRVINDSLEPKHQVFIAEMGAQHVGDIKHLVRLVKPKYGMITSIGPQHLDTFGSIANVVETKNELIEGLPEDGAAFFASDCGYTDRLFARCPREKYNAAVEPAGEDCYMRASELSFGPDGTRFVLTCADGGRVRCHTRLLGRFNVQNIALSAALAHRLGMSMEEIGAGIAQLAPFDRKLHLIPGGRTTIDDTLNASLEGAAEAFNVLSEFPGRRIVVTPGLPADLPKAEEMNYALGTQMKGCVDFAILVGDRRTVRPILKGILSTGFPRSAVRVVADSDDAEAALDEVASEGDTVLYECEVEEA